MQDNNYNNQYQQNTGYGGSPFANNPRGVYRNPVMVIVLSFITCGIYGLIWHYQISNELNNYMGREVASPLFPILGLITCGITTLISEYNIDNALYELDNIEGRRANKNFILWLILSLVFGVGYIIFQFQVQDKLNEIWEQHNGPRY